MSATTTGGGPCKPAEGERDEVGSISELLLAEARLDCEPVGGGETVRERALVETDADGSVVIEVDDNACTLRPSVAVEVRPEDAIDFKVVSGPKEQVRCDGTGVVQLADGSTLVLEQALVFLDGPTVRVAAGFVTLDVDGAACRRVFGPLQQGTVEGLRSSLEPIEPTTAWSELAEVGGRYEMDLDPGSSELAPGLADALEKGNATLSIDGSRVDTASDLPPEVVRSLFGHPDITSSDTAGNAPVELTPTSPTDTESSVPTSTEPEETAPPEQLVEVIVVRDPEGRTFTADVVMELSEQLSSDVAQAQRSGAYTRSYEQAFGATPDYAILRPDLLGDRDNC